jgi:sugar O-acyltransferase (sialic acid O-acetyltransferase NeuD family)
VGRNATGHTAAEDDGAGGVRAAIIGAGAHGRVVLDILRAQARYRTIEFVDENRALHGRRINGALVAGALLSRPPEGWGEVVVGLGNPHARLTAAARAAAHGVRWTNAIHPSAVVMPSVHLGQGIMIAAGAVVNTDAEIRDHVLVNTGAVVEHDNVLEEGATVCPGAQIGGRVHVEPASFIGTGAVVLPRLTIGRGSIVAAASLVTKDVPPGVMVLGIPARVVEEVGAEFDWSRAL